MKELYFITFLANAYNTTKEQIIDEFNTGWILVFNLETLHTFYEELELDTDINTMINEDIQKKILVRVDNNTYAMRGG